LRLFLASFVLLLACLAAFRGAWSSGALTPDIELAYNGLVVACWFFFLLSLAVAVMGSTDRDGRLRAPRSLGALLCWLLLIPQAGLAIGRVVNYRSTLDIIVAASNSPGADVLYLGDGVLWLDGEIGSATLRTLSEESIRDDVYILHLQSNGGVIDSAVAMGLLLDEKAISTFVDGYCESACVIVALSSDELYVSRAAQFGFHRGSAVASRGSGLGRFLERVATDQMLSRLRSLGVPEEILQAAGQTPPESIYYVSGEDLYRAGLAQHLID
jgi:hypothetical protein